MKKILKRVMQGLSIVVVVILLPFAFMKACSDYASSLVDQFLDFLND